ncbi:hypothetical protein ASE26_25790 [Duganella sp. Root198D2]|nr:hypothetical protein ASD07_27185 [Duganella sp. Root336D2]KRB96468.1 hypothetical protein ASE26_25790 [Duganella sp. Root198D2]
MADEPMPTHCGRDEISFLDAWFGDIDPDQEGDQRYSPKGKLLSLCVKRKDETIVKVSYRIGKLGHPNLESVASRESKFGVYSRQDTPHFGEAIVFFTRGSLTHYVVIATGQGHGVFLHTYKDNKRIASQMSSFEEGVAYQVGPEEVNIVDRRKKLPMTFWAKPPDKFR